MPVKVLLLPGTKDTPRSAVVMSPGLALQLSAVTNLDHEISFGRLKTEATVITRTDLPPDSVRIGAGLRSQLHLPLGQRLYLSRPGKACLRFGPLVGLLTTRAVFPAGGFQSELFEHLSRYGRSLGAMVYVFVAADADIAHNTTYGWHRSRSGMGWVRELLPLPDVIYDRVPNRKAESRPELVEFKDKLKPLYGASYFNPHFFNKWETYCLLQKTPELQRYLPETVLLNSAADVEGIIRTHGIAFLKPAGGSLGRGVIKMRTLTGKRIGFRLPRQGGREVACAGAESALSKLKRVIRSQPYIVQQGIRLATCSGAPFDVRILAQKGAGGRWFRTKIYARVAPPGTYISNISKGATPASIAAVLASVFPGDSNKRRSAMASLRNFTQIAPPAVEAALGDSLGEIGLDVGIDINGRLWLIEVNSKPMRTLDPHLGTPDKVRAAIIRPLVYARYLAGFEPAGTTARGRRSSG